MILVFNEENDLTLTASKWHFKKSYGREIFTHDRYIYLMLVSRSVISLAPLFSVCTPLSVCSPFGYLRCFKSNFDAVKAKVELFNE